MAIRKMGKASFAQILDQNGKIQIFIKENNIVCIINYPNFNFVGYWRYRWCLVKYLKPRQMKFP